MTVHVTRAGVALTVGIVVLTGLLIGSLFWVQQAGEEARRDEAITIAEQNLEKDSNKEIVLNDGAEQQPSTAATSGSATETPPTTELPQTGPVGVSSVFVLGMLAFTIASYYRSRRTVADAL